MSSSEVFADESAAGIPDFLVELPVLLFAALRRHMFPGFTLALVVCLEKLLHVVHTSKLLLTARMHTCNSLLSSVDFRVPRRVV